MGIMAWGKGGDDEPGILEGPGDQLLQLDWRVKRYTHGVLE